MFSPRICPGLRERESELDGLMPKIYYYSKSDLTYKSVPQGKLWSVVVAVVVLSAVLTMVSGYFGVDPFGLKSLRMDSVASENAHLKSSLASLNGKLHVFQRDMATLGKSDNLIRTSVNLPIIPKGIRDVSIGGVEENGDYGVSPKASSLIAKATQSLATLDREAKLQKDSYRQVLKKYESNKVLFAHIPAIEPIRGGIISDGFGMRFHPILHILLMHEGIDIEAPVGTPVHVSGDGVVTYAGRRGGYGNVVVVDNGFGYETLYAHLSKFLVKVGQKVKRGQVIALSGDTGLSTGPHLHYGVMKDGVFVNPAGYFFKGRQYESKRLYDVVASSK